MERERANERAEADAARIRSQPRERCPRIERRARGLAEAAGEVVGAKQPAAASCLRRAAETTPALPGESSLPLDHQAQRYRHRVLIVASIWSRPYHNVRARPSTRVRDLPRTRPARRAWRATRTSRSTPSIVWKR